MSQRHTRSSLIPDVGGGLAWAKRRRAPGAGSPQKTAAAVPSASIGEDLDLLDAEIVGWWP